MTATTKRPFVHRVLNNPRRRQPFTLIRTETRVNDKGRTETTETEIAASGVIYPSTPEEREALADGERVGESITVHSETAMTTGDDSHAADTVIWRGNRYMVTRAPDWQDYGFTTVIAVLQKTRGKDV